MYIGRGRGCCIRERDEREERNAHAYSNMHYSPTTATPSTIYVPSYYVNVLILL